jgi:hypothetical protein
MVRYSNMWGASFVGHYKGNNRNQVQNLANNQATQTKVAHTVVYAKKVESGNNIIVNNYALVCRALCEMAANNVFELTDTDE